MLVINKQLFMYNTQTYRLNTEMSKQPFDFLALKSVNKQNKNIILL